MFFSSYDLCIRRLQGKHYVTFKMLYTQRRINALSVLVNNQPTTHKCIVGTERVKMTCCVVGSTDEYRESNTFNTP